MSTREDSLFRGDRPPAPPPSAGTLEAIVILITVVPWFLPWSLGLALVWLSRRFSAGTMLLATVVSLVPAAVDLTVVSLVVMWSRSCPTFTMVPGVTANGCPGHVWAPVAGFIHPLSIISTVAPIASAGILALALRRPGEAGIRAPRRILGVLILLSAMTVALTQFARLSGPGQADPVLAAINTGLLIQVLLFILAGMVVLVAINSRGDGPGRLLRRWREDRQRPLRPPLD